MVSANDSRQKLIVIGNGMAGARTVEEILARGGGEQFAITVFSEEPYGNYNRILLSNVLCGAQDPSQIFLNPPEWYEEQGITLRLGVRADVIARPHKAIHCDDVFLYSELSTIAGASRNMRQIVDTPRSSAADSSVSKPREVCSLRRLKSASFICSTI